MQNVQYFVLGYENREHKIAQKHRSMKKNVIFYGLNLALLIFLHTFAPLFNGGKVWKDG
jgi:hypothetical protein